VGDRLTLSKGTLRYSRTVLLDPKEKSPFLELLPSTAVNTELLHFAPTNASMALVLSNGDGEKRFASVVKMLDTIVPMLHGRDRNLPSQELEELEQALKLNLGKDVAGKISQVAVAVGDIMNAPIKRVVRQGRNFRSESVTPQVPVVVVIQATDEDAAKSLMDLVPQVAGMISGGKGPGIRTKEIDGQTISILPIDKHESLHFGRQGSTIVLGPYLKPVTQALANGAAKNGMLADPKVAVPLKKTDGAVLVAVAKPVTILVGGIWGWRSVSVGNEARSIGGKRFDDKSDPPKDEGPPPKPEVKVTIEENPAFKDKEGEQFMKVLRKLQQTEEPLVVSLTRKDDRLQAEATMGGLAPLVAFITDFAVEQAVHMRVQRERAWQERRRADEERRKKQIENDKK
jgi:hypothetical protein